MLMEAVVPSIMPLRFKALGAPNTIMGLVITTIPGVINTFCNPVISFKSDRFRSRWGRRIPFIVLTLPLLVLCLVALGFGENIAFFLHGRLGGFLAGLSPTTFAVVVMGIIMALFSFFNTFVNSVFWYLFNDVVPEGLLARFTSWFRIVSLGSGAVYNLFVFKYAGSHSKEILVGAGLLYFAGFGLMCFKVREGQYPPAPENIDGEAGIVPAIKTYTRECMALPHYWFIFLANMGIVASSVTSMFTIFFLQSRGLTLEMAGRLAFASSISGAVAISVSGWLADRFHPIRIVIAGVVLQVVIGPVSLMWLFWHPAANTMFYILLGMNICIGAPIGSLISVIDPPLMMRLFPRERYGQFCSANSMCRSLAGIAAGVLVGLYLDCITAHWGADVAYACMPIWNLCSYLLVLWAVIKLYRSWKEYGGDESYSAPLPGNVDRGAFAASGDTPELMESKVQ